MISRPTLRLTIPPPSGFNLVIEVLLISSVIVHFAVVKSVTLFQSRNRGSFDFKSLMPSNVPMNVKKFQSRNRGSFDFKLRRQEIQSQTKFAFQSRNRGSFDFKTDSMLTMLRSFKTRFNLVIEVLLISSLTAPSIHQKPLFHSFNLVIEVLLISSPPL